MMKKRFVSKYRISTSDPENVSFHSSKSFQYGDIVCCGSCSIEDRISSGLQSYVFGSLPRPPEFYSSLPRQCNSAGLVCQFLKSLSKNIDSRNISDDDCVAMWRFCDFREIMILLEDAQQNLEYGIDDRFRFFVELFTLWCGVAYDLYTVSEGNFRHHIAFRQEKNYKFVVVTCCLYFCGDDCHGFLKLEWLVNEFYVEMLMNSGGLQVMVPHGDSSLTIFYVSGIVVMVQPSNIFFKQEACYLEVLISFVIESFLQILFSGSDFLQQATSSFLSLISREFDSTVKIVIKLKIGESDFGSDFLQQAKSSFLFLIYREFDSMVKIIIKLKIGESDFVSSYDEFSSIAINRIYMSASFFGFICGRFLRQRSMMILLAVSHCVSYLIQSDISDFLGCSAEYDNGSISMDKYPSFSGLVEFNTLPDFLFVEDRMLRGASWLQIDLVLGFQDVHVTAFDGLHILGELKMVILEWLIHISPLEVYECVRSLYKKEVKFTAHTLYGKSTVTETLLTNKDLSLLFHGAASFVGQEYVNTSNRLSTFIFGSLPRPPELHCASLWFSSSLLRFTRMLLSLKSYGRETHGVMFKMEVTHME